MGPNLLYYGDNLDVLRDRVAAESVDLIYLDPPFNTRQNHDMICGGPDVARLRSSTRIKAFGDSWKWTEDSRESFRETVARGGPVAEILEAFGRLLGGSDMLAYLTMMAPRLVELHRILKADGSLYLHCDPTASHYLKIVLDAIFEPRSFRNEILWKRTPFAGSSKARARQFPRSHDVILFYTKGETWHWSPPSTPYTEKYLGRFRWNDEDGRGPYRKTLLKTYSEATFRRLEAEDRLVAPVREGAKWSYKQYLRESSGTTQIDDVWTDINALNPQANERLDYPTQKPEALLDRIIETSCPVGGTVLDPFSGCGTTIASAQRLGRRWIGIDINTLATSLIKQRLFDRHGPEIVKSYRVIGEPESVEDARILASSRTDASQFTYWVCGLLGARPTAKDSRKGIDGWISFRDAGSSIARQVVVSIHPSSTASLDAIHELTETVETEKASIGVLITMQDPGAVMKAAASTARPYFSADGSAHPRIQILSVQDLFSGEKVDMPSRTDRRIRRPVHRVRDRRQPAI